jgi:hypothetical protein
MLNQTIRRDEQMTKVEDGNAKLQLVFGHRAVRPLMLLSRLRSR